MLLRSRLAYERSARGSDGHTCHLGACGRLGSGMHWQVPAVYPQLYPHVLSTPWLWNSMTVVAGGCLMLNWVVALPCPGCGNLFHAGPRFSNDFARRCGWCGLRLDGSNATEAFEVKSSV